MVSVALAAACREREAAIATIRLLLPHGRLRRWHKALADRLAAEGHRVLGEARPGATNAPPALALVETLEDLLYGRGRPSANDIVADGEGPANEAGPADLVFDLTGAGDPQRGAIAPLYDGAAGDAARDAILLEGRAPEVELALIEAGEPRILAKGLPAIERPSVLRFGRDAVTSRVVTLALGAAATPLGGAHQALAGAKPPRPAPLGFFAASLAAAARRRLRKLVAREGHWRVGLRPLRLGEIAETTLDWRRDPLWRWVPDDRGRYFADPFLFEENGVAYVFCEEFPYATQKGIISVFALDAAGVPGPARVVLEQPYHLSYPGVFRHGGQIFMMPESSANRTLEVYRADPFPYRWTLDRVILDGVEISDATAFEAAGAWWLTGATNEPGTSTWDCLSLFSGPGPLGPWTPSGDGPVLVDASAARPAGSVFRRGGELWRPAQDCTQGYGSGLALCRIDDVGHGTLRQTVMRRWKPPGGMHTFNASDRFAAIDTVGDRARSAWADRLVKS
jgi:hypothetical protein